MHRPFFARRDRTRSQKPVWLAVALVSGLLVAPVAVGQERPRAVDLLPERTSVYVQINNVRELVEDFRQSNFGRMLQDEQIAPLVGELYAEAQSAYEDVQEQVGVPLAELQSLPTGEICFAIITPRRETPVFALLADVSDETGTATTLLERVHTLIREEGGEIVDETRHGLETKYVRGDEDIWYVLHQGTFLVASNETAFDEMIARWAGDADPKDTTLASNRKFTTIMNKCRSIEGQPLTMSFFVDPITLARSFTQGNASAGLVFGALRVLGIDGVSALGGAAIFNEQDYESIFHGHLLLSSPREGIFEMIALKPGIFDPEPFVPENCATYMTSHWDARKFMAELEKIVDTFTSEGTFRQQLQENVNDELEIDLQTDLIENLEGRITYLAWMNSKSAINAQSNALAVQVIDLEKAESLVNRLMEKANVEDREVFVQASHNDVSYWKTPKSVEDQARLRRARRQASRDGKDPDEVTLEDLPEEDEEIRVELRPTQPCMGFIGESFVITESTEFFEYLIDTQAGDHPRMADDDDYQSILDEMRRLLGTEMPSVTMYTRPAETFRMFFDLAQSDNTRELLARGAEDNKYLAGLKRAYDEHPLPPFDVVAHYFPPQGAFVVNDDTGFHFLAFQRRAEDN